MILLLNTIITDYHPRKFSYDRGNLKNYNNFDILKYCLLSYSKINWKRAILNIQLEDDYISRKSELEELIKTEFLCKDLILNWKRNIYQSDWIKTYELLNDNLIWFYCNHDHIFLDSSLNYLNTLLNDINDEEYVSIGFSHWPESIRTVKQGFYPYIQYPRKLSDTYKIHSNYVSVETNNIDSIQIISKKLYYDWWFNGNFENIELPRTDYFNIDLNKIKKTKERKSIVPLKELCRHFDGYVHVTPKITNAQCPSLDIPNGIFEKQIKIRYGYDDRKEGWININPKNPYYYAENKIGTDYKFTINDIPLFWKDRIIDIDINKNINEEEMIQYRLKSILQMIYTDSYYDIDKEVETMILNEYVKELGYKIE